MFPSNTPFGVDNYHELWAETIASVLSQFTGQTLKGEVDTPGPGVLQEGRWVRFILSGVLSGEQAFWFSQPVALHLAQSFMAEPLAPEAEFSADHADALAELIRQFAGTVASQLKAILGSEASLQFKDATAPAEAGQKGQAAALQLTTAPPLTIVSWIDDTLVSSIANAARVEAAPAAAEPSANVQETSKTAKPQPQSNLSDKNLDLLLDLQLEVSIRFGQRQMMLKDVLELNPGSVVELDRRTRDPIELILGGRVIARGEAVVIDGNYGIRVVEVLSPAQRVAQLS